MDFAIDGDEILYRATAACQTVTDWGDGEAPMRTSNMWDIQDHLRGSIERATEALGGSLLYVALSDRANYRKDLWSGYKANRSPQKPHLYEEAREWLMSEYEHRVTPSLEADDVLGLDEGMDIASSDKDFNTITGRRRYSFYHDKVYEPVEEHEADYNLFVQAICGDPSDGYKGIPGSGIKFAQKALNPLWDYTSLEDAFIAAFLWKGYTVDDALLQLRLARILRPGEYDYATLTPILYQWKTPYLAEASPRLR